MNIHYCSKCDKPMTDEHGTTVVGVSISVTAEEGALPEKVAFVKKQLGKYALNHDYEFCYECWLDSLFAVSPS
jgi:hypothetical protein